MSESLEDHDMPLTVEMDADEGHAPLGNFTFIHNALIRDGSIPSEAFRLYSILLSYAWNKDACFPTVGRLSSDMGGSRLTAKRWMRWLEERRMITRTARFDEHGKQIANLIRLLWRPAVPQGEGIKNDTPTNTGGGVSKMNPSRGIKNDTPPPVSKMIPLQEDSIRKDTDRKDTGESSLNTSPAQHTYARERELLTLLEYSPSDSICRHLHGVIEAALQRDPDLQPMRVLDDMLSHYAGQKLHNALKLYETWIMNAIDPEQFKARLPSAGKASTDGPRFSDGVPLNKDGIPTQTPPFPENYPRHPIEAWNELASWLSWLQKHERLPQRSQASPWWKNLKPVSWEGESLVLDVVDRENRPVPACEYGIWHSTLAKICNRYMHRKTTVSWSDECRSSASPLRLIRESPHSSRNTAAS